MFSISGASDWKALRKALGVQQIFKNIDYQRVVIFQTNFISYSYNYLFKLLLEISCVKINCLVSKKSVSLVKN